MPAEHRCTAAGISQRRSVRITSIWTAEAPGGTTVSTPTETWPVCGAGVERPWVVVRQAACAMAAGVGVGRFVYTPILPLMQAHAGMSAQVGALLATANYIGYLAGAVIGTLCPAVVRSQTTLRASLLVLVATLALMPATHDSAWWFALRALAGVSSALVFVITISALLPRLRGQRNHLAGWTFGGAGAGIALSGLLVAVVGTVSSWQVAWWASAALTTVFLVGAWPLNTAHVPVPSTSGPPHPPRTHRWFSALFASYTLEGIGYIIAGTFLVAAIEQRTPGLLGAGAWVLVGLAALPSCALWAGLSQRWSRPTLLLVALLIQAVGIALPALFDGVAPALISAFLFGATFLAIGTIALPIGEHLGVPRAVAILTVGYSAGQILGPLVVTPLLHHGYHEALLLGSLIVACAALAAAALRLRFPHHLSTAPTATFRPEVGRS
jgi:MFS family permease